VEISLRDDRGQAIVEYVLVLVVAVSIILGGIYQLNSAFKVWANNYFGNYLACLLETGELPSLGGANTTGGLCNSQFKPFSLADGRPLKTPLSGDGENPDKGRGGFKGRTPGSRESANGSGYSRVGSFGPSFTGRSSAGAGSRGRVHRFDNGSANTGNTDISNYGSFSNNGSGSGHRQLLETRLDNRFAFDEVTDEQKRRDVGRHKSLDFGAQGQKTPIRLKSSSAKRDAAQVPDSSFTISNFLRFLIIAAIIIALVMFLGGQALNISKSMDGS
jgi:hypothetical protein